MSFRMASSNVSGCKLIGFARGFLVGSDVFCFFGGVLAFVMNSSSQKKEMLLLFIWRFWLGKPDQSVVRRLCGNKSKPSASGPRKENWPVRYRNRNVRLEDRSQMKHL